MHINTKFCNSNKQGKPKFEDTWCTSFLIPRAFVAGEKIVIGFVLRKYDVQICVTSFLSPKIRCVFVLSARN
jgi:hypothetical protein